MTATNTKLPTSFTWLNVTQFFGALNDNLLKLLVIFCLIGLKGAAQATTVAATAGALFVIPFLLFSPVAGALADKLSKRSIILAMKGVELGIVLLGLAAFALESESPLYGVLFLMATQSALFGPAKYGIVPELVKREQLSKANSLIETLTWLAIICGTALAPLLTQFSGTSYRSAGLACVLFSAVGLVTGSLITRTPAADSSRRVNFRPLSETRDALKLIRKDGDLFLAILGSAYFLFLGAFVQIELIPFGMELHALPQKQSGYLFLVAAIGIGIGSLLAGRLSGRNVEFGIVPLGALGLTLSTIGLALTSTLFLHLIFILLLGISAGLFIVPLQAFIQLQAPREQLGRVLAASGVLSWCGVLLASALTWLLSGPFGLDPGQAFLVLGLLTCGLTLLTLIILPDFLLRFIALLVMRLGYRIDIHGEENVPAEGPALLVANHVSWIDALLLSATQQRRIRFIMHRDIYNVRLLNPLFRLMKVIPVAASDSRRQKVEFIQTSRAALDDGYLVCIFAEGMITRTGMLQPFQSGLEAIVKGSPHPLIPVHIGGAWGSIFSYAHGKPLSKLPLSFPYPVTIHFGPPLPATCKAAEVQQAVAELACAWFDTQKEKRTSLAALFVKTACVNWLRRAISDGSKQLSYGRTLTAARALADQLKPQLRREKMVGLLLPPSVGGALANLALALLGKIPVNLNYTSSPEAVRSAIDQCGIETLITSRRFVERFPQLPLATNTYFLENLFDQIDISAKLHAWVKARLLPLRLFLDTPLQSGDEPATVIFSSGSTGEPKGVVLSQHNIISNLEAIRMVAGITPTDNICGALPFFHALGFTATLWLPLTSGFSACYHPNPMEPGAIVKLIRSNRSTLLLTTPTFLAGYMRRARKEDLASLRLIVTGAEKLKESLADAFAEKFGLRPLEGYGATELAPLITLSIPDVKTDDIEQRGYLAGSVGRPVPGVVLRVIDPDSGAEVEPGVSGLILVKGPNLMAGYLNRPDKTTAALVDGWYNTSDIGHIDKGGFLHITDRLARFCKIGGEMVPHGKVEDLFYRELQLPGNTLAVTSVSDAKKGEKLVVVYTAEAGDLESLAEVCNTSELPNLWRPRPGDFIKVDALPLLGSGKLDLQGLRKLAENALKSIGSDYKEELRKVM